MTSFGAKTHSCHPYDQRWGAMCAAMNRIERRQQWTWIIGLAALLLLIIVGCAKNAITGGQAAAHEQAVRLRVSTPDYRVELDDSRESQSTTQPSARGADLPRLGEAALGELASISFSQAKKQWPHALPLGLIFVAAAVVLWLLGSRVFAIAAAALAVLTFLAPDVVIWGGLGVLAVIGWRVFAKNQSLKQIVDGVENLFKGKSLEEVDAMKAKLAAKQDTATQREVRRAKGKTA